MGMKKHKNYCMVKERDNLYIIKRMIDFKYSTNMARCKFN